MPAKSASAKLTHDHRPQPLKCARPAASLQTSVKRQKALRRRHKGHSFQRIGQALGVSVATAHGYVNAAWERLNQQTDKLRRQVRDRELAQLQARLKELLVILKQDHLRILDPDKGLEGPCEINQAAFEQQLAAIDEILRIHDRQRVLFGLPALDPENVSQEPGLPDLALPES